MSRSVEILESVADTEKTDLSIDSVGEVESGQADLNCRKEVSPQIGAIACAGCPLRAFCPSASIESEPVRGEELSSKAELKNDLGSIREQLFNPEVDLVMARPIEINRKQEASATAPIRTDVEESTKESSTSKTEKTSSFKPFEKQFEQLEVQRPPSPKISKRQLKVDVREVDEGTLCVGQPQIKSDYYQEPKPHTETMGAQKPTDELSRYFPDMPPATENYLDPVNIKSGSEKTVDDKLTIDTESAVEIAVGQTIVKDLPKNTRLDDNFVEISPLQSTENNIYDLPEPILEDHVELVSKTEALDTEISRSKSQVVDSVCEETDKLKEPMALTGGRVYFKEEAPTIAEEKLNNLQETQPAHATELVDESTVFNVRTADDSEAVVEVERSSIDNIELPDFAAEAVFSDAVVMVDETDGAEHSDSPDIISERSHFDEINEIIDVNITTIDPSDMTANFESDEPDINFETQSNNEEDESFDCLDGIVNQPDYFEGLVANEMVGKQAIYGSVNIEEKALTIDSEFGQDLVNQEIDIDSDLSIYAAFNSSFGSFIQAANQNQNISTTLAKLAMLLFNTKMPTGNR